MLREESGRGGTQWRREISGEKNIFFDRNVLQHTISMDLIFNPPPSTPIGENSTKSKVEQIRVRSVFKYFLSLRYILLFIIYVEFFVHRK